MGAKSKEYLEEIPMEHRFPKTPYQYISIPDLPTSGYRD